MSQAIPLLSGESSTMCSNAMRVALVAVGDDADDTANTVADVGVFRVVDEVDLFIIFGLTWAVSVV